MTIYKAVRNFLTVFVVLAVAAGALCIGGGVYYAVQPTVFTAMPPRRR